MILVGLTGSIGMGKSTATRMLRQHGIAVFDSDAEVHRLMGPSGGALEPLSLLFPGLVGISGVDRARLARLVFGDHLMLRRLEGIIHPLLGLVRQRFLAVCARRRVPLVVLDTPLMFETGGDRSVDAVIVVTAPAFLQRQRVLARPGMDAQRLRSIQSQQLPDAIKRRRADFVVGTGLGHAFARRSLLRAVERIRLACQGRHWRPGTQLRSYPSRFRKS